MLAGSVTRPTRYPPILCSCAAFRANGLLSGLQVGRLEGAEKQSRDVAFAILVCGNFAAQLAIDAVELAIFKINQK